MGETKERQKAKHEEAEKYLMALATETSTTGRVVCLVVVPSIPLRFFTGD